MLSKQNILEVGITNATQREVLKYIENSLQKSSEKIFIVTPNPEILVYATRHESFRKILNSAQISLADGIGVLIAGKILGRSFPERITGTDLLEKLCSKSQDWVVTVGFLGGRPGVAEKTAECLKKKYPKLNVAFAGEEWPRGPVSLHPRPTSSLDSLTAGARRGTPALATPAHVDILFVAYGFPKQEEWIAQNLEKIPVKVAMGVGGAFDFISGNIARAPQFVRSLGLEWLFRLMRQPWRIKRQLALVTFISLVFQEMIQSKK